MRRFIEREIAPTTRPGRSRASSTARSGAKAGAHGLLCPTMPGLRRRRGRSAVLDHSDGGLPRRHDRHRLRTALQDRRALPALRHRRAAAALAAAPGERAAGDRRHRDERTVRRLRPDRSGPPRSAGTTTTASTAPDLHHQWLARRPRVVVAKTDPGAGAKGTASSSSSAACPASSAAAPEEDRVEGAGHLGLFFDDVRVPLANLLGPREQRLRQA